MSGELVFVCVVALLGITGLLHMWRVRRKGVRALPHPIPSRARRRIARATRYRLMRNSWGFRWGMRAMYVGATLSLLQALVMLRAPAMWGRLGWYGMLPSALILAGPVLYLATFIHRQAQLDDFLDRVRSEDFRFCPQCLYSLRGLGESGTCPECGTPFSCADLVQRWQDIGNTG